MANGSIPTRPLGKTGENVSLLCVGGAHIGVPAVTERDGIRIVQQAIDAGATFLDNAWEYNDGESERRMGKALAEGGYRQKAFLMTKDCAHDRKALNSMLKLEQSLKRLKTDYLDLWQIHEVVWEDDPDWIFAPGGSIESLAKAKEQGKVRFIGFTGHKHPEIHKKMLSHGFPFDTVQMPLNLLDAHHKSFEHEIVPICTAQNIGIVAMKSLADGHLLSSGANISAAEAMHYTMSLPISTLVSGMDSIEILEKNLEIARTFAPLSDAQRADLLARSKPFAGDGAHEPFKSTRNYDANEGRVAHGHPLLSMTAAD